MPPRRAWWAMLALASLIALFYGFAILPSPLDLALYAVLAIVFTAPGWPLANWVLTRQADPLTRAVAAVTLGYLSGAVICCVLRVAGVSGPLFVLGACGAVALLLARLLRDRREGLLPAVRLTSADHLGLALLWLVALAIVGPVFARVGEPTAAGLAYRAYFNADLFVHMGVVAELAKGATPPLNPYYPVEPLPYYWGYFTLPALFAQLRPDLSVDRGIMLTDMAAAVAFLSVGYIVVRNLGASVLAAVLCWSTIVLASSFEGAYFLWDQWAHGRPLAEFRDTNMDAITRWNWNLPSLDGFQRAMWWTPQHELALALGLILIWTIVRGSRKNAVETGLFEGLLLGGAMTVSSFNGLLLVAWYACAQLTMLGLDRGRDFGGWVLTRGTAAVVVVGAVALVIGLGIVQFVEGSFILGLNPYFLRGPWKFVLLNFGPALFLAPIGLLAMFRSSTRLAGCLAALVVVSILVFLLVELRGHENTQVSFRTGQLLWISLAVGLAFAIDAWRRWNRVAAAGMFAVLAAGTAAALPTVALDWYNAHDISNVTISPGGFPWTVHLSRSDEAAARWVQQALPPDATIQTDAVPRARYTWALVPAFFERRMATGNGIAQLNPGKVTEQLDAIHRAFGALPPDEAHRFFRQIGADYLYLGDVERQVHGKALEKFGGRPDLFRFRLRVGSVEVYEVVK